MAQLKISGRDRARSAKMARVIGDLSHMLAKNDRLLSRSLEIMGPIEAPLAKIANQYRWQILLKGAGVKPIRRFMHRMMFENAHLFNNRQVKVTVDIDPFFMM